jgi:hypothetical protein
MKQDVQDRRTLLAGFGAAAAAAVAFGSVSTRAQATTPFAPTRHTQDEWLDQLPGKHRAFIDSSSSDGANNALAWAQNLFTANKSGYGLEDAEIATIVCFRHLSTPFAFNDAMWAKYGKTLATSAKYVNPRNNNAPTANPHQRAIDGLAKRGVQFAICDLASHRVATELATATGGHADDVYKELVANAAPNSHFVAAGVVGVTRAQEYGYSLLVAG